MRLLVTRPEPAAGETVRRLREAGHEVHSSPVLEIILHPVPDVLPPPGALAVTSRHGVRALARWPRAPGWHDLPLFAVGEASADQARALGFRNVHSAQGDAPVLAGLIARHYSGANGPLIYPAARERAVDLGALLAPTGIKTIVVEAYHAVAAHSLDDRAQSLIRRGELDGVLVYSRRSAAALVDLVVAAGLEKNLGQTVGIAISRAAAEPLAKLGLNRVQIADRPDEVSMLAQLEAPRRK
jgi:uroporphyrinogen-III synthase